MVFEYVICIVYNFNLNTMKNKLLLIATLCFLFVSSISAQTAVKPEGDGSKNNPYLISSVDNLCWLWETDSIWSLGLYFRQTADIDVWKDGGYKESINFLPIGRNASNPFTGFYNGAGHKITDFWINSTDDDYYGLFGYLKSAKIDSLGVNVDNQNGMYIGGLAGKCEDSEICVCESYSIINGGSNAKCSGGLVGESVSSTIIKCCSTWESSGKNNVGGLVGRTVGGIVKDCYNTSMAHLEKHSQYGGLIGEVVEGAIVLNCYSVPEWIDGEVDSTCMGGLIGSVEDSEINNCYYDSEITGLSDTGKGEPLTSAEMQTILSFENWDFAGRSSDGSEEIWTIKTGKNGGYPVLLWQISEFSAPVLGEASATYNIDSTSIALTCSFESLGSPNPVQYGFCYSTTNENPEVITCDTTCIGAVNGYEIAGAFSDELNDMYNNYRYYVRAYAINASDTIYSDVVSIGDYKPKGKGTQNDPYLISDLADLRWLSETDSAWTQGYYFKQTEDIDAVDTKNWHDGKGFKPINAFSVGNKNYYNGCGHVIEALYINRPNGTGIGLFAASYLSDIDSVRIINCSITGNYCVGGVSGSLGMGSELKYCYVSGIISGENNNVGGLVGSGGDGSVLENCFNEATVKGYDNVGGLMGIVYYGGGIYRSCNTGSVSGSSYVGGFVGYVDGDGFSVLDISYGYNVGSVYGDAGLVGFNNGVDRKIGFNYITGGTDYTYISAVEIRCVYVSAYVTGGKAYIGDDSRVLGLTYDVYPIYLCYFNSDLLQSENIIGARSNKSMQTRSNFGGWNFENIWTISSSLNNGFPILQWQIDEFSAPEISNASATFNSDSISAKLNCSFTSLGIPNPVSYGFCYSTDNASPDILTCDTTCIGAVNGYETAGEFTDIISGVSSDSVYYVRAYAINAADTVFSNVAILDDFGEQIVLEGEGTEAYPYLIASLDDLRWLSETDSVWSQGYYFKQTVDIDASDTKEWNDGAGFSPIGLSDANVFTGNYNGAGHVIENLYVNLSDSSGVGLFGYATDAVIDSLGILDCEITGDNSVGAIVGTVNSVTVSNSFATGSVTAKNSAVAITIDGDAVCYISNCYSVCSVDGDVLNIGIAGGAKVINATNVYCVCSFSGGLTGVADLLSKVNFTNCYYRIEAAGQSYTYGNSLSIAALQSISTYVKWDFAGVTSDGTDDIWTITSDLNDGYPVLTWQIEDYSAPELQSTVATLNEDGTSATLTSAFSSLGLSNPVIYGFCYATDDETPDIISSNVIALGAVSGNEVAGEFSVQLSDIDMDQTYYVRSYAANAADTVYSANVCTLNYHTTVITNTEGEEITIYPNPVSSTLYIENVEGMAVIYNVAGQHILSHDMDESNSIDLSELENGVYLLRVGGQTFKVIKK